MPGNEKKDTWDPRYYSNSSTFQQRESLNIIEAYPFKGDEVILDIGCGDGKITRYLASRVPQGKVIGIDSSKKMIEFAQSHYAEDNLIFLHMSAEEIPYKAAFDLVFSFFCLHWVANKQDVFSKIFKSLKPGGNFLSIMPIRNELLVTARREVMSEYKWAAYFKGAADPTETLLAKEYDVVAAKVGFKVESFKFDDVTTIYESCEKLTDFIRGITQQIHVLPNETLRNEFMEKYVNEYLRLVKKTF